MEGINRDYATRVQNYIIAMTYYEDTLNRRMISAKDDNEIEIKILAKCQLSEKSIFRMNVEPSPSDYDRIVEKIEI